VLFADIAGYTKLSSELGAEETHALLNRYFGAVDGIVESYGGAVDKHMGDNVMAVFGAPVAHDDDPLRAVRAALDIHRRMAALSEDLGYRLQAHVGIANGQVVASGTGSDAHREYTVTGDSVNLASRLQDRAAPGETLVSDTLHRAVSAAVDCEPLGEVAVKGLAGPVPMWRVAALRDMADQEKRGTFVGRQAEVAQFSGVVEACRANGVGQAVVVRGEAGIGKTRLVETFIDIAADRGFASHRGLVLDFGVGKGQDAVRSLVRSLLQILPGGGKALRQTAADRAIDKGLIAGDRRVFLNDLLDLAQPVEERAMYDAMDNATRNDGKRAIVTDLLRGASAASPILVVVEDLHWADPLILTHLAAMANAVADCPALLVMTSRIEGDPLDPTWRAAIGGCPLMTIELGPLRRDEALTLAGAFLDATKQFAQDCIERAGGNPLFLEQLLLNAKIHGEGEVPASIQSLVLARMDRLVPADRRALQAASVIGQRFALDALRRVLDDADYACTGLIEHHLVRPEADDFLFAHALIRDGVYTSLLKATRQELHVRAAKWFADYDLILRAEHLDRADDQDAPKAYLEAAQGQASLYRYDRALELVKRGRDLAKGTKDEFALTSLHGQFLTDVGMVAESLDAYRHALELATDDIDRCKSWIGIAAGLRLSNESTDALAVLEQAESIAVQHDLTLDLARLHHLRGNLYFPLGKVDACGEAHGKALEFARKAGSAEAEARSLGGMGDAAYVRGRMITAHRHFSNCVQLCREQGFGRIEVANLAMVGWISIYLNELRTALDTLLAAAALSKKVGERRAELNSTSCAITAMYELGDMSRAPPFIERKRELIEHLGARAWEPGIGLHLAQLHETEGRHRQAIDELERSVAMARETSVKFRLPQLLGIMAAATDDPSTRANALKEGEALLQKGSVAHGYLGFYRDAMEACLKSGDWHEVERYAAALEDYTRSEPLPQSDFFIARARVLAAYGRGKRDGATAQELKRLRDEAERVGLKTALPALEKSLTTVHL
jgi:class 3 adenylate cyclase/tetratricopeptide (TPR) repeat protein